MLQQTNKFSFGQADYSILRCNTTAFRRKCGNHVNWSKLCSKRRISITSQICSIEGLEVPNCI